MAPKISLPTPDSILARPFVKSAGGKTRLLPKLHALMPKRFGSYHEPFVGGGALFWSLASSGAIKWASITDTNADLIAAYCAVWGDVDTLINLLARMKNTKPFFHKVRARKVDGELEETIAARMIYLNKTCYNGLWRVNRSGQFNTPFGHYKNPPICDEPNLRACARVMNALEGLVISRDSFDSVLGRAEAGDFVYFDPPYLPLSKTSSFTAYGSASFGFGDHARLAGVARELKSRKVHVMISNCDHPEIRKLYTKGFKIHEVTAARSINAKGDGRGHVSELVIT
jgi:DNA adenine methylase